MNNDFEKYLENFNSVKPSGEFRQKVLAVSKQAWKARPAQSSIFSLLFSHRSLLWAQAAMIAAAVTLICVENTMTDKLLADARPKTENGTGKETMEICREFGIDETYCRVITSARNLLAINDTRPVDFAAYQKTMKTIMEEGIIQ
jgi:hypothetical protein